MARVIGAQNRPKVSNTSIVVGLTGDNSLHTHVIGAFANTNTSRLDGWPPYTKSLWYYGGYGAGGYPSPTPARWDSGFKPSGIEDNEIFGIADYDEEFVEVGGTDTSLALHYIKRNRITGQYSLWGRGGAGGGQLGDGTTTTRSSPVLIGYNYTKLGYTAGGSGDCRFAIRTDGTLWSWGWGDGGKLGRNTVANASSPIQVGTLSWIDISGGGQSSNHMLGIRSNGTLWGWGTAVGPYAYGISSVVAGAATSSPVQVGSANTWTRIVTTQLNSLALRSDGTIWAWGEGAWGATGQNNTTNSFAPVQIGALTNWAKIAIGHTASCLAVKTDGTLWSWGYNNVGQLGLNNTTNVSSPIQVGSDTDWADVRGGGNFAFVTKTDGTLWAMGDATLGRFNPTATNVSSPTQVGTGTGWKLAGQNGYNYIAFFIRNRRDNLSVYDPIWV